MADFPTLATSICNKQISKNFEEFVKILYPFPIISERCLLAWRAETGSRWPVRARALFLIQQVFSHVPLFFRMVC